MNSRNQPRSTKTGGRPAKSKAVAVVGYSHSCFISNSLDMLPVDCHNSSIPARISAIMFTTADYWQEVLGRARIVNEKRARQVRDAFYSQYGVKVPLLKFNGHKFEEVV